MHLVDRQPARNSRFEQASIVFEHRRHGAGRAERLLDRAEMLVILECRRPQLPKIIDEGESLDIDRRVSASHLEEIEMEDGPNGFGVLPDARKCDRVRGVHDHGGLDRRWRRGQRLQGRCAAPIHANDACLSVVAQRRDERFEILAQCDGIENSVRRNLGRRIATQERRDRAISRIREDLHLHPIRPGVVGKAMHEHDKWPAPLFEVGKPHSIGLHVFQGGFTASGIRSC